MNTLLWVALAFWLAADSEPARTLTVKPKRDASAANAPDKPKDPVELEYEKLLAQDETALSDIEKWVGEFQAFEQQGAPGSRVTLSAKVEQRVQDMQKAYEDFLGRNPKHVEARIAYGSFLNEVGDEEQAIIQWEKARDIDPKNPTPWNNLANIFGHIGPVKKAFQYYEKAIELNPNEPVYIQNLATTVYLFRKDAAETYRIDEKQVFDKALELYRRAMKLDPTNLVLAVDYAQSYYGIRPTRVEDAIAAWKHALSLAHKPVEKQGIYLHLARVELNNGLYKEAEEHLSLVEDPGLQDMKKRLQRNLEDRRSGKKRETEPPPIVRPPPGDTPSGS